MQRTFATFVSALGILLTLSGCQDSPGPDDTLPQILAVSDSSATLSGRVVSPDSLPVARAQVTFSLIGPVPPDTTPPDTVPPDTLPPDTTGLSSRNLTPGVMARSDSIPGDSTPPPPFIPCNDRGKPAARTRTDGSGLFSVSGLAPGVYHVRAQSGQGKGLVCGVTVRSGAQMFVTIMLTRRRG